ncbi:MAG: beta-galactosidase, partial [bacterium]
PPVPYPHGEQSIHGLKLDWKRFVTDQTIDFYKNEIKPLKEITPEIPATTNFMGTFPGINYWKFAQVLDLVSWDSYPLWHNTHQEDWQVAVDTAFKHDINRSLKNGQPFLLMESTPSMTNWTEVSKLKRPGMHLLSSIQAVAHGSDSVQYFQWRKGRGGTEKFHGAVVDHVNHEHTRVFAEVSELGELLEKLDPVHGSSTPAEVAIIFDWENRWALEDAAGIRRKKDYEPDCINHYQTFWQEGIPVDIINQDCDFSKYKLLIAPMLYMIREGVGERIEEFVENGGTLVCTYLSGLVDENDLCFMGGVPGPLRKLLGIWIEETDGLYNQDKNKLLLKDDNMLNLAGEYHLQEICDLVHAENAEVLATYGEDFYAGRPVLTCNKIGKGEAYYLAARSENKFLSNFYKKLVERKTIRKVLNANLPKGVTAQLRTDDKNDYIFLMNFNRQCKKVELYEKGIKDLLTDTTVNKNILLDPFALKILKRS